MGFAIDCNVLIITVIVLQWLIIIYVIKPDHVADDRRRENTWSRRECLVVAGCLCVCCLLTVVLIANRTGHCE